MGVGFRILDILWIGIANGLGFDIIVVVGLNSWRIVGKVGKTVGGGVTVGGIESFKGSHNCAESLGEKVIP